MKKSFALLLMGGLVLAACEDNPVAVTQGIDSLGSDFVSAFNADANDDPADDIALTLTPDAEPFDP